MKIIINNSSMVPIYEQLVEQIKGMIVRGELESDTALPSVRILSKELKVSALTVKKAYDALEEAGLVKTIHGKGTFVTEANRNLMHEEQIKEVENLLEDALRRGRLYGLTPEELRAIFEILLEK
ncbi:MAG: GntR family transcriptional regulator [Acetatifactor sp.]|nr:GntR family transcriptional regulator [Acetatifactor sp.]